MDDTRKQSNRFWASVLVAAFTLIAVQLLRALFPLALYTNALTEGPNKPRTVVVTLLLVLLAPLLAPLITRWLSVRGALSMSLLAAALLRLAIQVSPSATLTFVLTTVALMGLLLGGTCALAWFGEAPHARYWLAVALLIGLAMDAALNSLFLTWDYLWQRNLLSIGLGLPVTAVFLYSLFRLPLDTASTMGTVLRWRQVRV